MMVRLGWLGGMAAVVLGCTLMYVGWQREDYEPFHGARFFILGSAVCMVGMVHLMVMWWTGRIKTLHRVYAMGYRHGRRDSSAQLLEDGLWLADRAEGSAARRLPPDDA